MQFSYLGYYLQSRFAVILKAAGVVFLINGRYDTLEILQKEIAEENQKNKFRNYVVKVILNL